MAQFETKGLKELDRFLQQLPERIHKNLLRGGLRAGLKPVLKEAKSNVSVKSGILRDGLKVGTSGKGNNVYAYVKSRGKHGHIANWLEYGTRPHTISAKGEALQIGGTFVGGSVEHPGTRPKPFMRPALDSQSRNAVIAMAVYMKKKLSTKHGLNTADIDIGESNE